MSETCQQATYAGLTRYKRGRQRRRPCLQYNSFQLPYGKVALINLSMIYGARFVIIIAFVLCPMALLRAEDKEPFAVIELGAATERELSKRVPTASGLRLRLSFRSSRTGLKSKPESSPLFRPGQDRVAS